MHTGTVFATNDLDLWSLTKNRFPGLIVKTFVRRLVILAASAFETQISSEKANRQMAVETNPSPATYRRFV